jgi:predicted XRE-type DNA-binding protein
MRFVDTSTPWEGLQGQEEVEAKAFLALEIRRRIETLGLTQREVARQLDIAQTDVSKIVNCKVWGFSLARLSHLIARLGADVDIRVRVRYTDGPGTVRIATTRARRAA